MSTGKGEIRTRFDELKPGDRIQVERTAASDQSERPGRVCGTVIRTECRQLGPPHFRDSHGEPFRKVILLELCDGELTAVPVDEATVLRRA